jgi:glutamine synthetase
MLILITHGPSLRIECRAPGGRCQPYLAFAATLAAGLDGIARQIKPLPMFIGDPYAAQDLPHVPSTLTRAAFQEIAPSPIVVPPEWLYERRGTISCHNVIVRLQSSKGT